MREANPRILKHGHIRVYAQDDPAYVLLDQDNMIADSSEILFARMLALTSWPYAAPTAAPCWGVWGLAVGAGMSSWANSSPTTPPPPPPIGSTDFTTSQNALYNQVKRKPLMSPGGVLFLESDGVTISPTPTTLVRFLTSFNATTDAISVPLMEMGLIGGGIQTANNGQGTDPLNAAFWDPAVGNQDSMVLINYATFGAVFLPAGVTIVMEWDIQL